MIFFISLGYIIGNIAYTYIGLWSLIPLIIVACILIYYETKKN